VVVSFVSFVDGIFCAAECAFVGMDGSAGFAFERLYCMSMELTTSQTNQVSVARELGYTRLGNVKFFKKHAERRECFGFAVTEIGDKNVDVLIHIEGLYGWFFDGGDVPALHKVGQVPNKGVDVLMTEPVDSPRGYRAERFIVSSAASFEAILRQIKERPVWRVWHNGDVVLMTANFNELLQRFPASGKLVSYPIGSLQFQRREWHDDEYLYVADPRDVSAAPAETQATPSAVTTVAV
jgi:hypothetical protein